MNITRALGATDGIVCVVGAGGKKTTMYSLARRLDRAVVSASVRIPIFDEHVARVEVTETPASAIAHNSDWPLGVVPAREEHRYLGYDPEIFDALEISPADAILIKADGARMRWFKAPGENEPRIPQTADVVIPIASAKVVGEPLTEDVVHRVERVTEITDCSRGELITADTVGAVLASDAGGLKGVPDSATAIPLINMVDTDRLAAVGRDIANSIHRRADVPHVVLASMNTRDPLVEIIEAK